MTKDQEMLVVLRAIRRLMQSMDRDAEDSVNLEQFSRLYNLLICLNDVCWTIHGERAEDKVEHFCNIPMSKEIG